MYAKKISALNNGILQSKNDIISFEKKLADAKILQNTIHENNELIAKLIVQIETLTKKNKNMKIELEKYQTCENIILTMRNDIRASRLDIAKLKIIETELNKKLESSVINGILEDVQECVELGADIHINNDILLEYSMKKGNLEIVKYLVDKYDEICITNFNRIKYEKETHLEIIEYFAEGRVNINDIFRYGAKNNNLEIIIYSIEKGAVIDTNKDTFLYCAGRGFLEVVEYFVENNISSLLKEEALIQSVKGGHLETAKYLVENGTNIHVRGDYVLTLAASNGYFEIVKYIVSKGVNIEDYDAALMTSAKKGYLEIVKYLLQKGANIHATNDYALCHASKNGHLEVVKHLVEKGAYIDANNNCAIIWSAKKGHLEVLKYLLVESKDNVINKDYALALSSKNGQLNTVKYLVENGANVHTNDCDAIKKALEKGHVKVVKYLAEKGVYANFDYDYYLEMSFKNGLLDMIKYLIEQKFNVDYEMENNSNINWGKIISRCNKLEIIEYTISYIKRYIRMSYCNFNQSFLQFITKYGIIYDESGYEPMQIEYDLRASLRTAIKKELLIKSQEILYKPNGIRMKILESEFFNVEKSDDYYSIS